MKYKDLEGISWTDCLDKYNFARLFDVIQRSNNSYFNLCKTIRFNNINSMLPKYYANYEVKPKDTWTNLSYKFFNTYKLWWLLCKFNDVKDPFTQLTQGKIIKIPSQEIVRYIIENLDKY